MAEAGLRKRRVAVIAINLKKLRSVYQRPIFARKCDHLISSEARISAWSTISPLLLNFSFFHIIKERKRERSERKKTRKREKIHKTREVTELTERRHPDVFV